ncbi:MAG: metallophosphoesterase family protein [Pirellulaceae bacterium]|nr:metallophosphoesterase family protein [Planctomycetales bacterium]
MKRIGVISDTHSYLDPNIFEWFEDCAEIWHAGDFGDAAVAQQLAEFRPLKGVYGNIDDERIRHMFPLDNRFQCEDVDVWITHIGGHPGKYDRRISATLKTVPPQLFITGHSHIFNAQRDPKHANLLYLNPGAAGRHGFHQMRTIMVVELDAGKIVRAQGIELGPRTATAPRR